MALNIEKIRKDFPIFQVKVHGKPLVYLDNAATTLKPQPVIDAISNYYSFETANVHRGVHFLSAQATDRYEVARGKIREFIHAESNSEIIITRGTTESINLVMQSYGRTFLKAGDEVLVSEMEHHSNLVPWQMLCEEKQAILKVLPINDLGEWDMTKLDSLLSSKTKIVAVNYISNSLGTINPIEEIIAKAHAVGAVVSIDAAQAVAHLPINVQKLDCDFLSFSSHKLLGPTGIGVLYGKEHLLEKMPPIMGGGDMIKTVSLEKSTWNDLPFKFEAGTPHISGMLGFGAALEYFMQIPWSDIQEQEEHLLKYATESLSKISGLQIIGRAKHKIPILSFVIEGIHSTDLATIMDQEGVAVRTGHHCTMPVLKHFNVAGTARASFSFYNTMSEVDKLKQAIEKAISFLR